MFELGCSEEKALGPPSRTSSSGGTTFAYWATGCIFSLAPPLRLRLNATWSEFGRELTAPPAPHESTVARVVLVTGSHFGAMGGIEVSGPTAAHAAMTPPLPPTAEWSDVWSASPLNVTISRNTFDAGNVIRFIGALPPRSSLLITNNAFNYARLLTSSGLAAGNIFESFVTTTSLALIHTQILVAPHASDEGPWELREGSDVSVISNSASTSLVGWSRANGSPISNVVLALAAVSVATAVTLSDDASLSLTNNSMQIKGATEPGLDSFSSAHVTVAGLFVVASESPNIVAAISAGGSSRVRIRRNNLSAIKSALSGTTSQNSKFLLYGAVVSLRHATSCVDASQIAALELHHNRATIDNCSSLFATLSLFGLYWLSSSATIVRGNASIAVNNNAISVQNSTVSNLNVHASYASGSTATIEGNASITVGNNSVTLENTIAVNNAMTYGCFWTLASSLMCETVPLSLLTATPSLFRI